MTPFNGRSRLYLVLLGLAAAAGGGIAVVAEDINMGFAAAIVGLYVLHLYSVRDMQDQWKKLRGMEHLMVELGFSPDEIDRASRHGTMGAEESVGAAEDGDAPTGTEGAEKATYGFGRNFAPGTVALIEGLMSPEEVSRTLAARQEEPEREFGDVAMEMGFLTADGVEDLTRAQQDSVFDAEKVEHAKRRIRAYRDRLSRKTGE